MKHSSRKIKIWWDVCPWRTWHNRHRIASDTKNLHLLYVHQLSDSLNWGSRGRSLHFLVRLVQGGDALLFIAKTYGCWKPTFAEQNYCEVCHFFTIDSSINFFTRVYISFSVAQNDVTHNPAYHPELLSSRTVSNWPVCPFAPHHKDVTHAFNGGEWSDSIPCTSGRKIIPSSSYVTERGKGKMERARGCKTAKNLSDHVLF
jgi:hypothetical protein